MKRSCFLGLWMACGLGLLSNVEAMPTLIFDADPSDDPPFTTGNVIGATGVFVTGNAYDVMFVEGTCAGVFSGCDELADFAFTSPSDAFAASSALLDQVLVGSLDTSPTLVQPCGTPEICELYTPYGFESSPGSSPILIGVAGNGEDPAGGPLDRVELSTYFSAGDTTNIGVGAADFNGWAVWTLSASQVSEPGTLALLGLGLAGMGFTRRRRQPTLV